MAGTNTLQTVKVQLAGGCELLFGSSTLSLSHVVPVGATAAQLIVILKEKYITDRPELFVDGTGVGLRPGILLLVNNCDIEVYGGMSYQLQEGDEIDFISTLHGG